MVKRKHRKKALREPGDTPTPEQLAKGHYEHGTITHAVERYQERVDPVTEDDARADMSCPAVEADPNYQDEITIGQLEVIRRLADPDGKRAAKRVALYPSLAEFGAPFVRLAGGARAVIRSSTVVTVLPAGMYPGKLERRA